MQDKNTQDPELLWQKFEKSGSVNSYLIYKGIITDNKENTTTNQQRR